MITNRFYLKLKCVKLTNDKNYMSFVLYIIFIKTASEKDVCVGILKVAALLFF